MRLKNFIWTSGIALVVITIWGVATMLDPKSAYLPVGSTNLTSIQPKLEKLSQSDFALVIDYVQRSRGDVLPASMADPDEPFTARTVGEAIELQRKYLAQQAIFEAKDRERRAARDKGLEPLRAALTIQLVKREILPRTLAVISPDLREAMVKANRVPARDTEVLLTTYRLENISGRTIESLGASVIIRKAHRRRNELGILADCHITRQDQLAPRATYEFECGNTYKPASSEDQAFVAMPDSEFIIEWEPKMIRFTDGTELKFSE